MRRLRDLLPKGQTLPDESWEQRHRWMVNLLWFHVAGLFAFSLLQGFPVWHSALDAAPVAAAAIVERFADGRKLRSAIVATGLLTASALVVHVSGGYVEAHFHFFVMIVVLTLYEDWIPFLLATFYVVLHHGIGSSVGSGHLVFRDADHIAHPWKWAGIHAAFVAAAGLASIVSWRLNERVREGQAEALEAARESEERFRSSFDDADDRHVPLQPGGPPHARQPRVLPHARAQPRGARGRDLGADHRARGPAREPRAARGHARRRRRPRARREALPARRRAPGVGLDVGAARAPGERRAAALHHPDPGHQRPEGGRRRARPPGAARPADRAAQPHPVRRPPRARARPLAPHRRPVGGRVHRRRPLQGRQRQPRPREPATGCCSRWARGWRRRSARRTPWRASAATSS